MNVRKATGNDLGLLADWNHHLIADEGHRNPMDVSALKERMGEWLSEEYTALIFSEDGDVAYALFRETEQEVYLRQFFVRRDRRRRGVGKRAMATLFNKIWPNDKRFMVDVLTGNSGGIAFWHSLGYQDYCLSLEIQPNKAA